MPTPIAVTINVALLAGCVLATRLGPGWRAWPTAEKINYAVMVAALWPWILVGFLTDPPRWYSAAALTVTVAALIVFLARQTIGLRRARADLERAQAEHTRLFGDHRP